MERVRASFRLRAGASGMHGGGGGGGRNDFGGTDLGADFSALLVEDVETPNQSMCKGGRGDPRIVCKISCSLRWN
jgi:hypothetical protein